MSISKLIHILVPPSSPKEIPSNSTFVNLETKTTKLPDDYKAFLELYGTGSIDDFIWIFNPASNNVNLNFINQMEVQLNALRELQNQCTALNKYLIYPEPSGLLPFGITDNGDLLLWKTDINSEKWNIILIDSRMSQVEEFNDNFSDFLFSILSRTKCSNIFPDDFPSDQLEFKPI